MTLATTLFRIKSKIEIVHKKNVRQVVIPKKQFLRNKPLWYHFLYTSESSNGYQLAEIYRVKHIQKKCRRHDNSIMVLAIKK